MDPNRPQGSLKDAMTLDMGTGPEFPLLKAALIQLGEAADKELIAKNQPISRERDEDAIAIQRNLVVIAMLTLASVGCPRDITAMFVMSSVKRLMNRWGSANTTQTDYNKAAQEIKEIAALVALFNMPVDPGKVN